MDVFVATRPRPPWGDYGKILVHGMSAHLPRVNGVIQLERTAPFIPPITFPGISDVIVTDSFRQKLEASNLRGASFGRVTKRRIVELVWEHWDRSAKEPAVYPERGEPEHYILSKPHDENASMTLGELWELTLSTVGTVRAERPHLPGDDWKVTANIPPDAPDLFRATGFRLPLASARAKTWLEKNAPGCVELTAVLLDN